MIEHCTSAMSNSAMSLHNSVRIPRNIPAPSFIETRRKIKINKRENKSNQCDDDVSMEAREDDYSALLFHIIEGGGSVVIAKMASRLCDPNWRDVLREASYTGHTNIVCWVLEDHKINQTTINESLCIACRNGHTDIAKMLAKHGANNWSGALQAYCLFHLETNETTDPGIAEWLMGNQDRTNAKRALVQITCPDVTNIIEDHIAEQPKKRKLEHSGENMSSATSSSD